MIPIVLPSISNPRCFPNACFFTPTVPCVSPNCVYRTQGSLWAFPDEAFSSSLSTNGNNCTSLPIGGEAVHNIKGGSNVLSHLEAFQMSLSSPFCPHSGGHHFQHSFPIVLLCFVFPLYCRPTVLQKALWCEVPLLSLVYVERLFHGSLPASGDVGEPICHLMSWQIKHTWPWSIMDRHGFLGHPSLWWCHTSLFMLPIIPWPIKLNKVTCVAESNRAGQWVCCAQDQCRTCVGMGWGESTMYPPVQKLHC